jgi:lysophospholipase L1-like esterase
MPRRLYTLLILTALLLAVMQAPLPAHVTASGGAQAPAAAPTDWRTPLPAHVTANEGVRPQWVAAWTASPQGPFPIGHTFAEPSLRVVFRGAATVNQTLRLIVHSAAGGSLVRVRLSNVFGVRPLVIGSAYVGLRLYGSALVPGSNRRLTFDKRPTVVIPPGREVYSDPTPFNVTAERDLAVSLYLPFRTPAITWHASSFTTSYATGQGIGDDAATEDGAAFTYTMTSWFLLDGVDVYSSDTAGAVVALGDSITDGWVSTVNGDNRWPDVLARRLLDLPPTHRLSVVDAGIAGNMVEPSRIPCRPCGAPAVARLTRDVLDQAGVRAVILFEGTNDLGHGASAAYVIAGLRAIAARVHVRGLPIFAATILPYGGSGYMPLGRRLGGPGLGVRARAHVTVNPITRERAREEVNTFIRTSKTLDGVIDLDALLRDPRDPHRLNPRYDSGDHLHPNALGLQRIGDAIPINALEQSVYRRERTESSPARPVEPSHGRYAGLRAALAAR